MGLTSYLLLGALKMLPGPDGDLPTDFSLNLKNYDPDSVVYRMNNISKPTSFAIGGTSSGDPDPLGGAAGDGEVTDPILLKKVDMIYKKVLSLIEKEKKKEIILENVDFDGDEKNDKITLRIDKNSSAYLEGKTKKGDVLSMIFKSSTKEKGSTNIPRITAVKKRNGEYVFVHISQGTDGMMGGNPEENEKGFLHYVIEALNKSK